MKKNSVITVLLIMCLLLSSCGKENTDPANAEQTEKSTSSSTLYVKMENGMYYYPIGGTTLPCRTRIEDYITDNGVFRYVDLAKELGWHLRMQDQEWNPNTNFEMNYDYGDLWLYLSFMGQNTINQEYGYYKSGFYPNRLNFGIRDSRSWSDPHTVVLERAWENPEEERKRDHLRPGTYYLNQRNGIEMYFSNIILMTYIMENYPSRAKSEDDFFGGAFDIYRGFWLVYEYDNK